MARAERLGVVIGIFGAIFSVTTFVYQNCRGPRMTAFPGNYIFLQGGTYLVGIPAAFANSGGRTGSVAGADLEIQAGPGGPKARFKLNWYTNAGESERKEPNGTLSSAPIDFYLYDPLPVKPSDTSQRVFWFVPDQKDFEFGTGNYTARVSFYVREGGNKRLQPLPTLRLPFSMDDKTRRALSGSPGISFAVRLIR